MKTIIFLIATCIFSINVIAGDGGPVSKEQADSYCAKVQDGLVAVMYKGSAISSDVNLANGTTIRVDGTVSHKDGTKTVLKEGQCVDKDGKIVEDQPKEKTIKEKTIIKDK